MFFSIIIPTYNREKLIGRAIKSVLNQSFEDFEIIVVDDGSKDRTEDVVNSFKDERIKYIYQENAERSVARNKGIKNASGQWICFLDSDDYFDSDRLRNIYLFSIKVNTDCILTGHKKYWEKNNKITKYDAAEFYNDIVFEYCQRAKPIATCEVIAKKSVFENNLFDERFNVWEDTHLFYRILSNYRYCRLNCHSYVQVLNDGSGTYDAENKLDFGMIHSYHKAIKDLFTYRFNELKLTKDESTIILEEYLHKKNQMFFYRGYTLKDFAGSKKILRMAIENKSFWGDSVYYIKSFVKLFLIKFK